MGAFHARSGNELLARSFRRERTEEGRQRFSTGASKVEKSRVDEEEPSSRPRNLRERKPEEVAYLRARAKCKLVVAGRIQLKCGLGEARFLSFFPSFSNKPSRFHVATTFSDRKGSRICARLFALENPAQMRRLRPITPS